MLYHVPDEDFSLFTFEPGGAGRPLGQLGWSAQLEDLAAPMMAEGLAIGRVARVDRGMPVVVTAEGTLRPQPAAHLVKTSGLAGSRMVVGDWVALAQPEGHETSIVEAIIPRTSAFSRKDPGDHADEQILAANIDVVFVVQSLSGRGLNLRRLERELVLAHESGARPVVVLSKADLDPEPSVAVEEAGTVALGVDVVTASTITGEGVEAVRAHVPVGKTAVFLGASGVGKSTLINRLLGQDVLAVNEVRDADDKGRHTTVAREMVQLPEGGIIIDTPGMRALALWDADSGIEAAFADILDLAEHCRFRDCSHTSEPGCAVLAAVDAGELSERRLESYRDLADELDALATRRDEAAWRERERERRIISKAAKRFYRDEPKRRGR